jgi:hypothetical protein
MSTALAKIQENENIKRVQNILKPYYQQIRPWHEFVDKQRLNKPRNFQEATLRVNHNIQKYKYNYIFIFLALLCYVLITNLFLLCSILFILFGVHKASLMDPNQLISIGGQGFNQKQIYMLLGLISIPLFYISSAGSAIFWLVGVNAFICIGHASYLEKIDDEINQV